MKVDIQIISTPTKQTNACVGINFANASYLINCGESTQRIAGQNRFRLSKLKTIFNTQVSWDAVGGIPGLLLSISEIEPKIEDLKLFGPKNLLKFIVSHSEFVKRPEMNLALSEVTDSSHPIYTDENLRVFAAIIYPNGTSPAMIGSSTISSKRQRMLQGMFKTELDSDVANQSDDDVHPRSILSFIFHIPSVPGKMDGKKATELGVEGKDRVMRKLKLEKTDCR